MFKSSNLLCSLLSICLPAVSAPPGTSDASRPVFRVWLLLALWLGYSLFLLAWHVLGDPTFIDFCRTR